MPRLAPSFACLLLVACGGQVADLGDGGAVDSASPPVQKDASVEAAPSVDCLALMAKITALTDQAKTCCPFCNSQQCGQTAEGLCCPVSITAASAPDLDSAVKLYKLQCGPVACPAIPCAKAPSMNCPPVPNGPSKCQ